MFVRSVVALSCLGVPAFAQQKGVAAQFFEAGFAAAKRGDYRVCAEAFMEAHRRAPHGAAIYNAALCWESANELANAANGYSEALERSADLANDQSEQARTRLTALAQKLGRIEIRGEPGTKVSVGPLTDKELPVTTFVEPGAHSIKAQSRDGAIKTSDIEVDAGATQVVTIGFPKPQRVAPAPPPPRPDTPKPSGNSWQVGAGWTGVGIGLVTVAVGGAFYVAAIRARNDFDSNRTNAEAHDRAVSRLQTARILGVAGGVLAGTGITLLLTAPSTKPQKARAYPVLSIDASGVRAHLEF